MSHVNNIVKKPWGYEYLMYENDRVALWFLYIKNGERTSMHCHPNKTTGLVLLDGKAEVSFLSNKNVLNPLSKIMIRKGLFHSTQAISEEGAFVLEIETPVDKQDLVRFQDSYGREGKPYEDSTFEYPKLNDCVWISEPKKNESVEYKAGNSVLKIHNISNADFFSSFEEEKNIMFLNGGLLTDYNINVAAAGDVVNTSVLKKLIKVFSRLEENTIVMVMDKE
jgi:mannose-6-phosphate isomerase-like protein (cupin superfamily)